MQVFQAIAQHQQVNLAANHLCISQPAASMALRELEKQLGATLFDRLGNRLEINSNGRHLLPRVRDLLLQAEEVENLFSPGMHKVSGPLLIGCSLTIGNHLLPSLLHHVQNELPGITPRVLIKNTRELLNQLRESKIDIALVEGRCQHQDLISTPWRTDQMLIVAHPDHPLAHKNCLNLPDLKGLTWILRENGSGSRALFDEVIAPALQNQYSVFEIQHTEAIVNSVIEGLGMTCISSLSVESRVKNAELAVLPVQNLNLTRSMRIVMHKNRDASQALKAFSEICLNHSV